MKQKIFSVLLVGLMLVSLAACNGKSDSKPPENVKKEDTSKRIGVALPTQTTERWIADGRNLKSELEALGYKADLQYADNDVQQQVSQIEKMVKDKVDCLVVAAVDSFALTDVLEKAKSAKIPVIAYDRLVMDTDALSYYVTFDNKAIGTAIADYIVEKAGLETAAEPLTFEMLMGSPDDNNAIFIYNGIMEVIQPYVDEGILVCKSGQLDFNQNNTLSWDQQTAKKRFEEILSTYYTDQKLDLIFSAYDGLSSVCKAALEDAGYATGSADWPMITGQDAEVMAVRNIIDGSQALSIFKDTRILAQKCADMVQAVLNGTEPEVNDNEQYDNGKLIVPAYLCTPELIHKDNYKEILIDSNYYKEEDITSVK